MTSREASQQLAVFSASGNTGYIIDTLEKIGKIGNDFDLDPIKNLLMHKSPEVRVLAIKNLAKSTDQNIVNLFINTYSNDTSSVVKREAVSAVGRQRNANNINFLIDTLKDSDPKIVCQAIRALLVFKNDKLVSSKLRLMSTHENEMVRQIINKEFFAKKTSNEQTLKKHTHVDKNLSNVVVLGDVLDVMKHIDEDSVHLTFTSPPYYNARDYSIYPSYTAYLDFLRDVFKDTYRITKEGRFLIVNTSPVIVPRISRAHSSKRYPIPFDLHSILTDIGWEFIDDIIWEKPEYSVKNRIGGFMQHRKPLAYKPNNVTEYIMVYRKKTDKLLDWNIHQYSIDIVKDSKVKNGFETTNIWKIHPKSDKIHSAIFPVELCQKVIEYYSFKGDLVFDPFAGSGTLGRTAKSLNRKFLLAEKEPKYFDYMKSLIDKRTLFDDNSTKFLTLGEFKTDINK